MTGDIEWAVIGDSEVSVRNLRTEEIQLVLWTVSMLQRKRWDERQRQATSDNRLERADAMPVSREDGQ